MRLIVFSSEAIEIKCITNEKPQEFERTSKPFKKVGPRGSHISNSDHASASQIYLNRDRPKFT